MGWFPRNFMQSEDSIHAISNNLIIATQAWKWMIKSKTSLSYSFCSILLQNIANVFAARDSFFCMNTFRLTEESSYVAFLNHTTSSRRCSLHAGQGIADLIKLSVEDFKKSFPLIMAISSLFLIILVVILNLVFCGPSWASALHCDLH